jgi:hypothetical protein
MAVSVFSKNKLVFDKLFHRRRRWSRFFCFLLQNFSLSRKSFDEIEAKNEFRNKIMILFLFFIVDFVKNG